MSCKKLFLLKLTDMFSVAVWKFYYKLMNDQLPIYFVDWKPVLPRVCTPYEIRSPAFHLLLIRHKFAENSLRYCLITPTRSGGGALKALKAPPPIFCSHAFNFGAALLCVSDFSKKID